ncbi:MAG: glycoside hydrolase [Lachnospiraceae bacterium]|jgi:hypothetical protein|nr:glycoside hydrolase [Lachnospiraceae bacterium]
MYLLPSPQEIKKNETFCTLHYNDAIMVGESCDISVNHYAKILKNTIFQYTGFSLPITRGEVFKKGIRLTQDGSLGEEEYRLTIDRESITIEGGSKAAVLYGIQTLRQIVSQKGAVLPCLVIRDYPDTKNRGFYHDATRGRIPTLSYLKSLADKLSYYKLNQLQLYIEHSFLFKDLSEVWRDDTPLTAEEIMELDDYCAERNIELVPSLSSFGHLDKLLSTKTYAHLCELPDSDKEPFSFIARMQHHTIDTTNEESFTLVTKMISEYMPLFRSKHFNLCADETFDLGKGRSRERAEEIGTQRMYIDFLKRLSNFVIAQGKIPMFWGDIISRFPEAIKELPKESICLNWGYAPEQREEDTQMLAKAGATQYLCPGVGGWNQLINLIESSYKNITRMCSYAHKYNGIGILNTDWGDFGHVNHPEFSTTGLIYGAAFSWNKKEIPFKEINKQISVLEYTDRTEHFVSIVADMATKSVMGWENVVVYMEQYTGKKVDEEAIKKSFLELDLTKVQQANRILAEKSQELYQVIASLDTGKRYLVKPYLVAAEGMILWNSIGATIDQMVYHRENPAAEDPRKLAADLENWFYQFKEVWRTVSKESELFHIQNVINWYADYLRAI